MTFFFVQVLGSVHILQEMFVVFVFFISGLTLKTDDMMKALRFKLELAYGMVTILFLTGFLGFAMKALPLAPLEFSIGEQNLRRPCCRWDSPRCIFF